MNKQKPKSKSQVRRFAIQEKESTEEDQLMIPMVEAAINWVKYKAYEIEDEKKNRLLAVLHLAQREHQELKEKYEKLMEYTKAESESAKSWAKLNHEKRQRINELETQLAEKNNGSVTGSGEPS